ncbi:MBL fold metallo-hydrolase [Streptomyces lydicus]|uniref:MBL fold metallo-hydrolase n=1 Tax=Streptomyces lydicus TaxID=47763 RepID=UPI00343E51B7
MGSTGDWTASGPEEVAPEVHRIPLPLPTDGLHAVNVYAVLDGERVTLIDGGWKIEAAQEALQSALSSLHVKLKDIERCLVTHHHRDHYTLAVELRRLAGLVLAVGVGEMGNIKAAGGQRRPLEEQFVQLHSAGAPRVIEALDALGLKSINEQDFELPDVWLDNGDEIDLGGRTLRVKATPGHTVGHVVFIDESGGLLFSGDHILPHITPSVGFQPGPTDTSPLADYLRSLAAILDEPDRVLLPAHGPAGGSAHRRAEQLLEHHEVRLTETAAAVRAGSGTAYETALALRWTRRGRHLAELDPFNQMLAVNETVAHLDVLRAQGRVVANVDGEGIRAYSTSG